MEIIIIYIVSRKRSSFPLLLWNNPSKIEAIVIVLPRDYTSAVCMLWPFVCLPLCPSITNRYCTKWITYDHFDQANNAAQQPVGLLFSDRKDLDNIGLTCDGDKIRVGWNRQIFCFIATACQPTVMLSTWAPYTHYPFTGRVHGYSM